MKSSLYFLNLIIVYLVISCNSEEPKKRVEYVLLDKDSVNMIEKSYWENGQILSIVPLRNKKIHGIARQYYENGKLEIETQYENGIKNGITKNYFEEGTLKTEGAYVNGMLEGIVKRYYRDGKLKAEVPYRFDNTVEGLKEYEESGKLIAGYPEIVFTLDKQHIKEGKITLVMKLSDNNPKAHFYQLYPNGNKKPIREDIFYKDGVGRMDINTYNQKYIIQKITVYSEIQTSLLDLLVLKANYTLALDN